MQVATSTSEGSNPEVLLARIAEGDKKAETMLVNHYYRGLLFVINRQANNYSLAEDIVQETFVVVLQKARANGIHNPAGLKSFIRQTGVNLLIGHFRKETRRDTHQVDDIDIHPPSNELEISQAMHSSNALEMTRQIIEELKVERDKEILRDFFIYEKSKEQICKEMGLKTEHFDRVLFRARQRLKQIILLKLESHSLRDSNLLSITIFISVLSFIYQNEKIIEISVRDKASVEHLLYETPNISSRYTPEYKALGTTSTSSTRYV